ncbi:ribosomal protein S21 [Kwoniella sp. DSM 27419]
MSMFFRSTLRATASSSRPLLPTFTPLAIARSRYNSTLPPSPPASSSGSSDLPANPSSSSATPTRTGNPASADPFRSLKIEVPGGSSTLVSASSDPDAWWRKLSKVRQEQLRGYPTSTSTGRSVFLPRGGDLSTALRRLNGLLRNSNMKKELRLGEFHEKPSVRRRRLISERHRRRFREMVRTKVQQVISMRNRG